MPLDPSISLGYRPPQVNLDIPSPIQQFGQVMSLRALMEQSQMRKMQIEQEQMQLDNLRQANAGEAEFRRRMAAGENLTPGQTYGILGPKAGAAYLEGQGKLTEQQLKQTAARAARLGSLAGSAIDEPTFRNAMMQGASEGLFDSETARKLIDGGYNPVVVRQFQQQAMTAAQQHEATLADERAKREAAESAAQISANQALTEGRQADLAGKQRMQDANVLGAALQRGPAAFAAALEQLPAERRALFAGAKTPKDVYQRVLTPEQYLSTTQAGANAAETARHNRAMEAQAAARTAGGNNPQLVQAVIDNPNLWQDLTPTAKGAIASDLAQRGFVFGKPLGEAAISKISESRSALAALQDLRTTLRENEAYIGPIAGYEALNPWSEARVAQAKINLVRQRVGKALEGGVLRKEDEEKYKQILATLNDTPSTAFGKVDNLIATLQRDLDQFIEEQRSAGRKVPPATEPSSGPPKINTKQERDALPPGTQYIDAQDGKTYTKR